MFEVIYISPSCKQAAEFIDRLFWNLKKNGIYNAEVDKRYLRLKTNKFIVSAISIDGLGLWRCYSLTKYYIDMVSDSVFARNRGEQYVHDRLQHMKSRFSRDVKEISEGELIEILTEVSNG